MSSNFVYDLAKQFGDNLGRRLKVGTLGDKLWIYPNSFGRVVLWIEPARGEPQHVVLDSKQMGDVIAALRQQMAESERLLEGRHAGS